MVELYKFNNKNFDLAGDIVLQPNTVKITMELQTGLNEAELTHPLDKEGRWKFINYDDVLSIQTPYLKLPKQLYRIYDRIKDMSKITIKARHIFYDLIDTLLLDVRPTDLTGEEALNYILKGTKYRGHSDLDTVNTAYYVRKNVIEAIGGEKENSFLGRWGGELFLNNFDISINKRIGMDNGVRIAYGKNLTGLEEEINFEEVVTRAVPVGADGLMLEGDNPWVDSPLINNYANVKMRVVSYDDVKVKETPEDEEGFNTIEEARAELIRRVKSDYDKGMDKPLVNYKVEFLDLSKIEEYKNYKILEETLLGDTVHISHKRLNIDIEARVIKIEYNPLTGKMESIELGNYLNSYAKEKADNSITIDNIDNSFDSNGDLKGSNINGAINAIKAPLLAQKDAAKKSDVVAILSEVTDPNDPNFGANMSGTKGVMIANKRTPDNRDWQWGTAISADGIVADKLIGKILAGNGAYFDLERGIIFFNKGKIQGSNSSWDLDKGIIKFTKGLIQGGSSSWNLDTGEVNFNKGCIQGTNSFWDLNNGIFNSGGNTSNGKVRGVEINKGALYSDYILELFGNGGIMNITVKNTGRGSSLWMGVDNKNVGEANDIVCTLGEVDINKKLHCSYNVDIMGNLEVLGNKNCIQLTKEYGKVPFYANEDINSLVTKTDIDNIYETKLQSTGAYKCIVTINQMIRECINTEIPYNIYILNKMDFGDIRISGQYPGYFVVESKVPIRFKYKLEGRRRGFENMNEQLVFDKAYKTKIKPKEVV